MKHRSFSRHAAWWVLLCAWAGLAGSAHAQTIPERVIVQLQHTASQLCATRFDPLVSEMLLMRPCDKSDVRQWFFQFQFDVDARGFGGEARLVPAYKFLTRYTADVLSQTLDLNTGDARLTYGTAQNAFDFKKPVNPDVDWELSASQIFPEPGEMFISTQWRYPYGFCLMPGNPSRLKDPPLTISTCDIVNFRNSWRLPRVMEPE